jgi:hypothetical protein
MAPIKETWPEETEDGKSKVSPEYLPRSEKEKKTIEVLRKGWRDIGDALGRGDTAEAERLRARFNDLLIEIGVIEKELDESALMEAMKMYMKPDRQTPDIEVREGTNEEAAEMVEKFLGEEAERQTRALHRGRPGQN